MAFLLEVCEQDNCYVLELLDRGSSAQLGLVAAMGGVLLQLFLLVLVVNLAIQGGVRQKSFVDVPILVR
jgi:hypothetical protein